MPSKIQLPEGRIGPKATKKILPWVELFWHNHKRYPTDTELATQFGFDANALQRLKVSKFYNECLKNRGITQHPGLFSDKQVAALALITNFTDPRPVNAKLAAIGVTAEMYNGWMQDPNFKRELQSRADDVLDNVYPEAQTALAKQVRNGNVPALKFYYELTGRANSPETINLKLTVARLIEAVERHVKDPAIKQAIAADIQNAIEVPVASVPSTAIPSTSTPKELFKQHMERVHNGD